MAVLAMILSALALAVVFDWNWIKRPMERYVSASTGRALVLAGDITADWSGGLLRPRFTLRDVRFSNPAWAEDPLLLDVEALSVLIPLRSVFSRPLLIEELVATGASVALEVGPDGRRSWLLDRDQANPGATVALGRIAMDGGQVRYLQKTDGTDLMASIATGDDQSTRIGIVGRIRGVPVSADLSTVGAAAAFDAATAEAMAGSPPIKGKGVVGTARLSFEGHLGNRYQLEGSDFHVLASGPDLSALRPLLRAALPATPPYRIDAQVSVDAGRTRIALAPSSFGDSRLLGSVDVIRTLDRTRIEASLSANPLDFDDLGPLIGAPPGVKRGESASPAQRAAAAALLERGRVLPNLSFDTVVWPSVDMDVKLDAGRVVDSGRLAVDALSFRARLTDGDLEIAPLSMSVAGGTIAGAVALTRAARPGAVVLNSKLRFTRLQLGRLAPKSAQVAASFGAISGALELSGSGRSVSQLLATGNGRLALAMGPGEVSNLLLELVGLDGGEALGFLIGGDRKTRLRCAVASMPIVNGTVTAEAVVMDTDDTNLVITGSADLRSERLDFTLHPKPKDWSLLSVRSPIHLRGSFLDPQVSADVGALGARAAAALLLGLLNPLAALLPLIETGGGEDADCRALLASVRGAAARTAVME